MRNIKEVYHYVKGKKVILVGPSKSLCGDKRGKWIDSFDVVVRINNYFRDLDKIKEDVGVRTDILYHCFGMGKKEDMPYPHEWDDIKYIIFANKYKTYKTKLLEFNTKYPNFNRFYAQEETFIEDLFNRSKLHLHTGVSSILHLLSLPIKELHAIGFSFYKDSYIPQQKNWDINSTINHSKHCGHNIDEELEYFKTEIKNYNNFYSHGILKNIISGKE